MDRKQNKYIGSCLDDFLEEEGMLEEVEKAVAKRIFVFRMKKKKRKQNFTARALGRHLKISLA